MKQCFVEKEAVAVIAFESVPRLKSRNTGSPHLESKGDIFELADVIEKPSVEEAPSNLAIAAVTSQSGYFTFCPGKDRLRRRGRNSADRCY